MIVLGVALADLVPILILAAITRLPEPGARVSAAPGAVWVSGDGGLFAYAAREAPIVDAMHMDQQAAHVVSSSGIQPDAVSSTGAQPDSASSVGIGPGTGAPPVGDSRVPAASDIPTAVPPAAPGTTLTPLTSPPDGAETPTLPDGDAAHDAHHKATVLAEADEPPPGLPDTIGEIFDELAGTYPSGGDAQPSRDPSNPPAPPPLPLRPEKDPTGDVQSLIDPTELPAIIESFRRRLEEEH